jgi:hypothetical protein
MSFQLDAAVSSLYFISLQDLCTCFGCSLHPSSGVLKTACAITGTSHRMWQVSSGMCRRLTHDGGRSQIVCHYQMLKLQFIRAPDDGWMFHPKHVEPFTGNKVLCKESVILLEYCLKEIKLPNVVDCHKVNGKYIWKWTKTWYNTVYV